MIGIELDVPGLRGDWLAADRANPCFRSIRRDHISIDGGAAGVVSPYMETVDYVRAIR